MDKLINIFREKPEAWAFLSLYTEYIHAIDDVIDEKRDKETFFRCFYLASILYSSDYFIRNRNQLLPIDHLINNMYADSVFWEQGEDEKKKQWSDIIRHAGTEMILAIIKIEFGWNILRQYSEVIRAEKFNL